VFSIVSIILLVLGEECCPVTSLTSFLVVLHYILATESETTYTVVLSGSCWRKISLCFHAGVSFPLCSHYLYRNSVLVTLCILVMQFLWLIG